MTTAIVPYSGTVAEAAVEPDSLTRIGCPLQRGSQLFDLEAPIEWLWHGYLARRQIALLTGQWKIGKTTMLAALLARLGCGGELAGCAVRQGRAVVLTEEGAALWTPRIRRHGIGDAVAFALRPFPLKPLPRQWAMLLDDLRDLHRQRPLDLIVIDPLVGVLAGHEESSSAAMTDLLRPLRELVQSGPGALIVHHPRKGESIGGQSSRGSGALPAFVDFLLELRWDGSPAEDNRRRRLLAWSRHEATTRQQLLELTPDGTDYLRVAAQAPTDAITQTIEALLSASPNLTANELLHQWPPTQRRPSLSTLSLRLRYLVEIGALCRSGKGHRFSEYRYERREMQD